MVTMPILYNILFVESFGVLVPFKVEGSSLQGRRYLPSREQRASYMVQLERVLLLESRERQPRNVFPSHLHSHLSQLSRRQRIEQFRHVLEKTTIVDHVLEKTTIVDHVLENTTTVNDRLQAPLSL